MPFEVTCGQCHGALLVEQAGVVVACPTCGAHLAIPADAVDAEGHHAIEAESTDEETSSLAALPPSDQGVLEEPAAGQEAEPFVSHSSPYLNHLASLPASLSAVTDGGPTEELLGTDLAEPAATELAEVPSNAVAPSLPLEEITPPASLTDQLSESILPAEAIAPQAGFPVMAGAVESLPAATARLSDTATSGESTMPSDTVHVELPPPPPREVVSRQLFFYVATYASVLTFVVIYLVYSMLMHREHALESLPDIEPPMQKGTIGMKTAKPSDDVPRGHVLRLGESRRFGSVRVTPLRITRGPVTFEHLFGDRNMVRDPSRPVYKLWLKFENVSRDQEFIPLSTPIVYKRHSTGLGKYKTNNFLAAETERVKKEGDIYYLFGLSENSEYALVGQNLNQALPPGGTWETFLAAEDSLDGVDGEWTWRVFFRKGYHPRSRRGVTTVIDVRFDGQAVVADETSSKPS